MLASNVTTLASDVATLAMDARLLAVLRRRARDAGARECCGALLGTNGRVMRAVRVPNSAARPTRAYRIGPHHFRRVERAARAAGLAIIGFYHSHPDAPPEPSSADRAQAWPGWVYLIIGFSRPDPGQVAAWRLRADRSRFDPVPLRVRPA